MNRHLLFWLFTFFAIFAFIFLFENILTPFIVALILAYLLNPLVNYLNKKGIPRGAASFLVLSSVLLLLTLLLVLISPLLYEQIIALASKMPNYMNSIKEKTLPLLSQQLDALPFDFPTRIEEAMQENIGTFASWLAELFTNIVSSSLVFYDVISFVIIMPIVAFYLLRDWNKMLHKIETFFPKKYQKILRNQARELDNTLSGFLRGQGTVCVILGIYYAIALTLIGLDFGIFIGFATGLLTFIPYAGAFIGFMASLAVAYFEFGLSEPLLYITLVFALGQSAEGNLLVPRLVGHKIGLHPVWVLFSLLAGAELFGFVGVLLAIPMAALLGVLIRFLFEQYFQTHYYREKKIGQKRTY